MIDTETNQSLEIKLLEEKVDQLIHQYELLSNENRTLKTKQEELVREKARLIEKTNLARTRVEAMITHLKSMETGT